MIKDIIYQLIIRNFFVQIIYSLTPINGGLAQPLHPGISGAAAMGFKGQALYFLYFLSYDPLQLNLMEGIPHTLHLTIRAIGSMRSFAS